jgi:hypothetical protein
MTGGLAERRTVPTELAALAAGVSEATIRKWASRGKITRYGKPSRAEYDISELMEILHRRDAAGVFLLGKRN